MSYKRKNIKNAHKNSAWEMDGQVRHEFGRPPFDHDENPNFNPCSIRVNQESIISRTQVFDGADVIVVLKEGYKPKYLREKLGENWEQVPDIQTLHDMSTLFVRLLQTPSYEHLFFKTAETSMDFNDHSFRDGNVWFKEKESRDRDSDDDVSVSLLSDVEFGNEPIGHTDTADRENDANYQ